MTAVGTEDFRHQTSLADSLLSWFPTGVKTWVAFSGGADSALVLAAATRALGSSFVTAATAVSPSLAAGEFDLASDFARSLGVEHVAVATNEMNVEGYVRNNNDRCYFCKATLLDDLLLIADGDLDLILTGTNADDVRSRFRPGIHAASERGVRAPLAEVGITKSDVRSISKGWALSTWDKPAQPCLSSRIAYGVQITSSRLQRVGDAERALRNVLASAHMHPVDLRVRDLGDGVRVEVDAEFVDRLRRTAYAGVIQETIEEAGFAPGNIAIEPFRSGSLNLPAASSRRLV